MDSNKTIENQVSQCKILEDGYKSKYFNAKSVTYEAKAFPHRGMHGTISWPIRTLGVNSAPVGIG